MTRLVLATALVVAAGLAPAQAAPNAQLVASVQQRLNGMGFREVDASTLTTRQIAALHLHLQRRTPLGALQYFRDRQRVQTILGWDD